MHEEGCLKRFIVPGISFFSLLFYVLQISRILFVSDFFSGGGVLCVSSLPNRGKCPLSVRYVNKNIGLVTGIGTVFALALMIPALSLAACCFVSLLSVIAGTIAVERMNDKSVK
jgi:CysZ protein